MIKFFRNIRKNLVAENKTSKYFKYAIGEIILVVIGILIALQINNWNEEKNKLREEEKILNALKEEIENNLLSLKTSIEGNEIKYKNSGEFLKKYHTNADAPFDHREIIGVLNYTTNKLDTSILNEILGTNSRALISSDATLNQLRKLKKAFSISEKTEFYMDDLWNSQIVHFYKTSGLGVYASSIDIDENYKSSFTLDEDFFSLLAMVNGYQEIFLLSERDLEEALIKTSNFLNQVID